MDLAGVAAFDHQAGPGPQPLADQVWCRPEHASSDGIGAISGARRRGRRG